MDAEQSQYDLIMSQVRTYVWLADLNKHIPITYIAYLRRAKACLDLAERLRGDNVIPLRRAA